MTPALIAIAIALGLGMGILGGGGSIVVVPLLTFVIGLPAKDAVVASLLIVAVVAAAGASSALLRGVLPLRIAVIVGVSAILGGLAGGAVGAGLTDRLQLTLLAVVMFGAAIVMWRGPRRAPREEHVALPRLAVIGLATGCVTGLVGVGGGFLIVPALVLAAHLSMPRAAAASLFVITLASLSALTRYWGHASVEWPFVVGFAAMAAAGAIAGGLVAPRVHQRILQQSFAVALVILGSYVLLKA